MLHPRERCISILDRKNKSRPNRTPFFINGQVFGRNDIKWTTIVGKSCNCDPREAGNCSGYVSKNRPAYFEKSRPGFLTFRGHTIFKDKKAPLGAQNKSLAYKTASHPWCSCMFNFVTNSFSARLLFFRMRFLALRCFCSN